MERESDYSCVRNIYIYTYVYRSTVHQESREGSIRTRGAGRNLADEVSFLGSGTPQVALPTSRLCPSRASSRCGPLGMTMFKARTIYWLGEDQGGRGRPLVNLEASAPSKAARELIRRRIRKVGFGVDLRGDETRNK